jgi:hypothetical protein
MRQLILMNALIATAVGFAAIGPAASQPNPNSDVETMNFDLWCQEDAALPPARCDKRTPQDESSFETHRASVELYEIPHRSAEYDQARVNRDIMSKDPIDNPDRDDLGAQQQYPNMPVTEAN